MRYLMVMPSTINDLSIVEEDGFIVQINFGKINDSSLIQKDTSLLLKLQKQIYEYLEGQRTTFDLPYKFNGSPFFIEVWNYLSSIPYGKTVTYKDIANAINHPKAYRAVGMACNRNPLPIIIPCHRVIGSNHQLIGFAGGLKIKESLLNLEKNS